MVFLDLFQIKKMTKASLAFMAPAYLEILVYFSSKNHLGDQKAALGNDFKTFNKFFTAMKKKSTPISNDKIRDCVINEGNALL
jgi:hypothetical protein